MEFQQQSQHQLDSHVSLFKVRSILFIPLLVNHLFLTVYILYHLTITVFTYISLLTFFERNQPYQLSTRCIFFNQSSYGVIKFYELNLTTVFHCLFIIYYCIWQYTSDMIKLSIDDSWFLFQQSRLWASYIIVYSQYE